DNDAKNAVPVPAIKKPAPSGDAGPAGPDGSAEGPSGLVPIRFAKAVYHKGEELVVWVDPKWVHGEGFEVKMERRVMQDGAGWEEVAVVDAESPQETKGEDKPPKDKPPEETPKGPGGSSSPGGTDTTPSDT